MSDTTMTPAQWRGMRERMREAGGDDFADLLRLAERFDRAAASPSEHALSRCLAVLAGTALRCEGMCDVYREAHVALGALAGLPPPEHPDPDYQPLVLLDGEPGGRLYMRSPDGARLVGIIDRDGAFHEKSQLVPRRPR